MGRFTKRMADELGEKMRKAQAKARERTLSDSEIDEFLAACVKAHAYLLRLREKFPEAEMVAVLDGGAVPNNYKYRAETSTLIVSDKPGRLAPLNTVAGRTTARSVAGGSRGVFYVEVRVPKEHMGRLDAHKRDFQDEGSKGWVKSYV